jgi:hypothetical protein
MADEYDRCKCGWQKRYLTNSWIKLCSVATILHGRPTNWMRASVIRRMCLTAWSVELHGRVKYCYVYSVLLQGCVSCWRYVALGLDEESNGCGLFYEDSTSLLVIRLRCKTVPTTEIIQRQLKQAQKMFSCESGGGRKRLWPILELFPRFFRRMKKSPNVLDHKMSSRGLFHDTTSEITMKKEENQVKIACSPSVIRTQFISNAMWQRCCYLHRAAPYLVKIHFSIM